MASYFKDVGCVHRLAWGMMVRACTHENLRVILWHMKGKNSGIILLLLWLLAVIGCSDTCVLCGEPSSGHMFVLMLGSDIHYLWCMLSKEE